MKHYTFIIAATSEVGSIQLGELIDLYYAGDQRVKSYAFDAPSQCSDTLVSLIGKGFAFNAGYNAIDTVSMVINLD